MNLTVGTRGSRLSLSQTNAVTQMLEQHFPGLKVETKVIVTTGDKLWDKPFLQVSTVGMFEKEIDCAVISGEVDFAVHSMKDLPIEDSEELTLAAVPKREPANDVLISNNHLKLADLPADSLVATGSPRRKAQLLRVRPDLKVSSLRGNIDTRMKKAGEGVFAATILAEAGLKRLGMREMVTERLSLESFTPSAGQGALAIVAKAGRSEVVDVLRSVNDSSSMAEVAAERAFAQRIGGGCKVPMGVVAHSERGNLTLYGSILSPDGKIEIHKSQEGDICSPKELGIRVATKMLDEGIDSLLEKWRGMNE